MQTRIFEESDGVYRCTAYVGRRRTDIEGWPAERTDLGIDHLKIRKN